MFTVNYLGSPQMSFVSHYFCEDSLQALTCLAAQTLNFSKSAVQVIGSYYQLIRLGKNGYRAIMGNLTDTADYLTKVVAEIHDGKYFRIISATGGAGLPLVAWQLKEGVVEWDEFALARTLRRRGWIVPAYSESNARFVRSIFAYERRFQPWHPAATE